MASGRVELFEHCDYREIIILPVKTFVRGSYSYPIGIIPASINIGCLLCYLPVKRTVRYFGLNRRNT
jgi:hypothetical protein